MRKDNPGTPNFSNYQTFKGQMDIFEWQDL